MEILYTAHAVERMQQRNISTAEVEQILFSPDGEIKQSRDKSIYYKHQKHRSDNMIAAVTVKKSGKKFEVLTVMVNFRIKK